MSHPAVIARDSKWAKAAGALAVPFAVGATAMGLAGPATADSTSYLQSLRPTYNYMSESQLLSAGNRACASALSGVPASDATTMISKEFGVSVPVAYEIVLASINHLGC